MQITVFFSAFLSFLFLGPVMADGLFTPEQDREVPERFLNDYDWNWQEPGIFGKVLCREEGGRGIGDVHIQVKGMDGWDIAETRTDDEGYFRLALEAGKYRLEVELRDYSTLTTGFSCCPVSEGRAGYLLFDLIPLSDASMLERERMAEEEAVFYEPGPISGVLVSVRGRGRQGLPGPPVESALLTFTDEDGNKKSLTTDDRGQLAAALSPGEYDFGFDCEGYVASNYDERKVEVGDQGPSFLNVTLHTREDLYADEAAEAAERLKERRRLQEQLEKAREEKPKPRPTPKPKETKVPEHYEPSQGIKGYVKIKKDGRYSAKKLEGASVTAVSEGGERYTATSLSDGYFSIEISEPGRYTVVVSKSGYVMDSDFGIYQKVEEGKLSRCYSTTVVDDGEVSRETYACRDAIREIYEDMDPPTGIKGSVANRDDAYRGIGGGEVTLYDSNGRELEGVSVTEDGKFCFPVAPGKYKVEVESSYHSRDAEVVIVKDDVVHCSLYVFER